MKENFITTKQAAVLTGYTNDYVGQLARQGHIESVKEGRHRLVSVSDLFNYIHEKEHGSVNSIEVNKDSVTVAKAIETESTESESEANPSPAKLPNDNVQPIVAKKIISPWADFDENKNSISSDDNLRPQLQIESSPKRNLISAGPSLQLLPAMSATASIVAILVFMMTIGLFINSESKLANLDYIGQNAVNYNLANVASLDVSDRLAFRWYQVVNQLAK